MSVWVGFIVAWMAASCGGRSEHPAARGVPAGAAGSGAAAAAGAEAGGDAKTAECSGILCDDTCVDPTTSDRHCGGCGLSCGSGCNDGRCVEVLASGLHAPDAIAVARDQIYVATQAGLFEIGKNGGTPRVIDPELKGVSHVLAVDDTHLYWGGSFGQELTRVAIAGGTPEVLAKTSDVSGIAFDANTIYWSDWQAGTIMSLAKSGGSPTPLTSETRRPRALAVAAERLYWAEDVGDGGGAVVSMPLGGGALLRHASGQDSPRGLAINTTHVYWTTAFGSALSRVASKGGEPELLFEENYLASNVVLDDSFAFWVDEYAVYRWSMASRETEELPQTVFPADVAVDDTSIYIVNDDVGPSDDNGTLIKLTPK